MVGSIGLTLMKSWIFRSWLGRCVFSGTLFLVGLLSAAAQTNDVSIAEKAVRRLFLEKTTRLTSMAPLSATNLFAFKVAFTRTVAAGSGQTTNRVTSILSVVVDQPRAAILVSTTNGLPYCFLADGFYAGFDPEQPGRLLVQSGGHALFRFSYHGDNKIEVGLAFAPEIELPHSDIDLNLAGAFQVISSRANMIYTDKTTKAVMLTLDGGAVFAMNMLPPENPNPFGVARIKLENSRSAVEIGDIALGKPGNVLLKINEEALRLSGVPCRNARKEEMKHLPLLVSPDFPRNEAERKAAERLREAVFKQKQP